MITGRVHPRSFWMRSINLPSNFPLLLFAFLKNYTCRSKGWKIVSNVKSVKFTRLVKIIKRGNYYAAYFLPQWFANCALSYQMFNHTPSFCNLHISMGIDTQNSNNYLIPRGCDTARFRRKLQERPFMAWPIFNLIITSVGQIKIMAGRNTETLPLT